MKPDFLLALILGLVFLAAILVVPHFLPAADRGVNNAVDDLNVAHENLSDFDPTMQVALPQDVAADLRDADMDQLAEKAGDKLNEIQSEANQRLNRWRQAPEAADLSVDAPNVSLNASRLAAVVGEYEQRRQANERILQEAARAAGEAKQEAGDVPAPAHLDGLVAYAQAGQKFGDAQAARREMTALLNEAELLSYDWRAVADRTAAAENLSASLTSDLDSALDDLASQREAAVAEQNELQNEIAQREQKISSLEQQIQTLRNEIITMENHREQSGSSSGFVQNYKRMRTQLGDLQQELLIADVGGLAGASFSDPDNAMLSEIDGGDQVVPLRTLKQRNEGLTELVARIDEAEKVLRDSIAMTTGQREGVASKLEALQARSSELQREIMDKLAAAAERAEAATQLEDGALQQANRAASSFSSAARAAGAWKSQARDLQGQYDADRKNERLTRIVNDKSAEALGNAAQYEAKLLAGNVEQHRAQALSTLAQTMAALEKMQYPVSADFGAYNEQLTASRENAAKLFDEVANGYSSTVSSQMPGASGQWATVNAAGAQFRLALLAGESNDAYRSQALQALDQALPALGNPATVASVRAYFAGVPASGTPTGAESTEQENLFDDSNSDDDDLFGEG